MDFAQKGRIIGSLVGLAAGDALGAPYEFQPPVLPGTPITMHAGGGWEYGEWTDDTAMAVCIAEVAATGADLRTQDAQDAVVSRWYSWSRTARDVGVQTRRVLDNVSGTPTALAAATAARELHQQTGRTGGNGSLMRTAPVALRYLDDEKALIDAAAAISRLTHFDEEAAEVCILWCLAIRHAVRFGNLEGLLPAIDTLPDDRASVWKQRMVEAEHRQPWEFDNNGWVVATFQAAWSAISNTADGLPHPQLHARRAIEYATRCGNDTDTVAAVVGSLVGAAYGVGAIPAQWQLALHGYPRMDVRGLTELALGCAGQADVAPDVVDVSSWRAPDRVAHLESVPGLTLGGQALLQSRTHPYSAAVSLSRVGSVEGWLSHHRHHLVRVLDNYSNLDNINLALQMLDVADLIEQWLADGERVLLHCVQAHTRTPSFAAAYLIAKHGLTADEASQK